MLTSVDNKICFHDTNQFVKFVIIIICNHLIHRTALYPLGGIFVGGVYNKTFRFNLIILLIKLV